ncbi:MAG: DUF58 domain-containing protein [Actinobacteria bacterium]|nr:DUF58 domain-containing protein [Actinomycetota bacterium]
MDTALGTFPLPERRRVSGLSFGGMRSVRRGSGSDVAGSRPYQPGDDVRTIDRHASARLSSAHGRDEFVVRQTFADEAARVVVVLDRRPSMALFPGELPWLHKPAALAAIASLIRRSASEALCVTGHLELDGAGDATWLVPGRASAEQLEEAAAGTRFDAAEDVLDHALAHLAAQARLPSGSFVFLVSDFLAPPADDAIGDALARRWQLVPVVVQDPVWERSFPEVSGAVLPVRDPVTGRVRAVRLSRKESRARREAHEQRWAETLGRFELFDLDPVVVDSHRPEEILESFMEWADRAGGVGGRL